MTEHKVRVVVHHGNLRVVCSCPAEPLWYGQMSQGVDLVELIEIAHDHIESADRDTEADDVISGSGDYRAESLVTSGDELVDLEAALLQARLGDDFIA